MKIVIILMQKRMHIKIKFSKSIKNELLIIELPIKNIKNEKNAAIGIEINGIPNNKGADGIFIQI